MEATMATPRQIDQTMKQTQRYWYEDGFQDMAFGGFILLIALLFIAQAVTPAGSPLWLLWGIGGPVLLIGGGIVVGKVVKRLKERVTYPRTGYVAYAKPRGKSRWLRIALVLIISAGVSAAIIIVEKNWLSITVILGFVYMATFSFLAYHLGLGRYVLLAVWCLALGLALAPMALSLQLSGAIYHVGAGAAMVLAGWLTWRQYDQNAPKPQEAGDDARA
jgi:hypothetical protein